MKITVEFNINPDDLAEWRVWTLRERSRNPEANLVTLLQHVLYDNSDGPQLEGHFNLINQERSCL